MPDSSKPKKRPPVAPLPGPARLVALLAGVGLSLLGVLGFFYDASFGTGSHLASDDLAGILDVNGWRNVVYLATGILALALAPRFPRLTALGLGAFYLTFGLWGLAETDRGIGSILDALPLGDRDNALHLIIGGTALIAALVDGPLPSLPKRQKPQKRREEPEAPGGKPKKGESGAKAASGGRRRSPATPRAGGGGGPR
jgi:hypothetical protein